MDKLIIIKEAFNMFFEEADSEDELFEASLVKISKNENYAEFIVPRFSDKTFKTHFRINPCVFEVLCTELNLISAENYGPGRMSILIEKQLMITLWYLGNQECMR